MATEECAEELDYENPPFPLTAIDRSLLAMKDADFHIITWADLQRIISSNTLEDLKRRPSDLRRYLAWSHQTKQAYGSITNYVIRERLHWEPIQPSSTSSSVSSNTAAAATPCFAHSSPVPFAHREDYAVLLNDWPYGLADGIHHLLVWTKTAIAVDDVRGDVTSESRAVIEDFVDRFFAREIGRENVLWFKNWVSLQSVRGVDHVHVMVQNVPAEVLQKWRERQDIS